MGRAATYAWVGGAALGAAAMYLLDPTAGRRRRKRAGDRVDHLLHQASEALERLTRDAGNRARGTTARARRLLDRTPVEDPRLEARLRAALGRLCSHPGAIRIEAQEGFVILRGAVLEDEFKQVLSGLRRVQGVKHLESLLEPERDASRHPELQGPRRTTGMPPDLLQEHMSPSSRAIVGMAAGALIGAGVQKRGFFGSVGVLLGGLLLYRALTNEEPQRLLGLRPARAVLVEAAVDVEAPVEEVFAFWSSFRNFPRFMEHVREIRETEDGTSRWVVDGPVGLPVSWDAEIVGLKAHSSLAWRSLPGSGIQNSGEVRFEELPAGGTRLHVRLGYSPPAGPLGQAVASFFGADPKQQLEDDLRRFKALLEEGSVRVHGEQVARQDVQPEGL